MIRTFLEFTLLTSRNRIAQRLRRLRDPRYLIGTLAGLAYLWFIFFRNTRRVSGARGLPAALTGDAMVDILTIVVLTLMIVAWALPSESGGLQFSEAEIAFLFPAPLRRRDLLLYKIVRAQPRALGSAIAFFIFGWRRSWLVGTWAAISVLGVYFTLVALGRARLKLLHIGFIARLLVVAAILAGLVLFAIEDTKRHPIPAHGYTPEKLVQQFDARLRSGATGVVLFVPRLFATAASAPTPARLAGSTAGVLAVGLLFFVIAARLNVSFEEASIVASAKRAAWLKREADSRAGRRRVTLRRAGPLFRLAETGAAEVAIVWKNVIALMRTSVGFVVLFLFLDVFLIGMAVYYHNRESFEALGSMCLVLAALFPLTAPQIFSNDLRLDLARAEILKSYPLSGERLVAAEVAAPLVVITALELVHTLSGSILIILSGSTNRFARVVGNPQFVVTTLILALPVCALLLLIRNAVPLYFPAWSIRPPDDVRGFVVIGQRLVVLFGNLLALFIALIPAAIVFAPSLWVAFRFFSGSAAFMAVASVPAAALVAAEVWLGTKLLGARFDAMDVSNEFDFVVM